MIAFIIVKLVISKYLYLSMLQLVLYLIIIFYYTYNNDISINYILIDNSILYNTYIGILIIIITQISYSYN